MTSKWINKVKKEIQQLKELKPADRLSLVASITRCSGSISDSLYGWYSWLSNPLLMKYFTEEELKEIFEWFRELSIKFLEFDLKWTEIADKKYVDESDDKHANYVS